MVSNGMQLEAADAQEILDVFPYLVGHRLGAEAGFRCAPGPWPGLGTMAPREKPEPGAPDGPALRFTVEAVNGLPGPELLRPETYLALSDAQFDLALLRVAEAETTFLEALEREGQLTHTNPTVVGRRDMHIFDDLTSGMHSAELQAYLDLWVQTVSPPALHEMEWVRYVRNLYFQVARQIWDPLLHGPSPPDLTDETDVFALMGEKNVSPIKVAQTFMQSKLQTLRGCMQARGLLDPTKPAAREHVGQLNKLSDSLHACYNGMVMLTRARQAHDSSKARGASSTMLFESSSLVMDQLGPVQKLILFLLDGARREGYRKLGTEVYKPHFNSRGQFTHSFVHTMSMEDFVNASVQPRDLHSEQWQALTRNGGALGAVVNYLRTCQDPEFPTLVRSRYLLAFRTGVFNVGTNKFYGFNDGLHHIPDDWVAAKYHDCDFNDEDFSVALNASGGDFMALKTPDVDLIFAAQKFTEQQVRWAWVMMGRMFHPVGELDNWQVQPFFKGNAQTGKSTLLRIVQQFYECVDVGIMTDQIEQNFGLEGIFERFLYLGMDISRSWKIPQTLWQSMVSGEGVSIGRKNKVAKSMDWKVPGMCSGNNVPNFRDNAGSVSRRWVTFEFHSLVTAADPRLFDKIIARELATIIKKASLAYLEAVFHNGQKDIWSVLPQEFINAQNAVRRATDPLEMFLTEKVRMGAHLSCTMRRFEEFYKEFCREKGFSKNATIDADTYRATFQRHNIQVNERDTTSENNMIQVGVTIVGFELLDDVSAGPPPVLRPVAAAPAKRPRDAGGAQPGATKRARTGGLDEDPGYASS